MLAKGRTLYEAPSNFSIHGTPTPWERRKRLGIWQKWILLVGSIDGKTFSSILNCVTRPRAKLNLAGVLTRMEPFTLMPWSSIKPRGRTLFHRPSVDSPSTQRD